MHGRQVLLSIACSSFFLQEEGDNVSKFARKITVYTCCPGLTFKKHFQVEVEEGIKGIRGKERNTIKNHFHSQHCSGLENTLHLHLSGTSYSENIFLSPSVLGLAM